MLPVINHLVAEPPAPGHRIHFVRLGRTHTMDLRELYDRAGRLAVALGEAGVRRGDRIGILAGNGPEWVTLDLAALRIGAVTTGFDPDKFAVDPALVERYRLTLLFAEGARPAGAVRPIEEVGALVDRVAPGRAPAPIGYAPDDVTTLKLTSGSTGEPKGMTASVGSIDSALHAVQAMFGHGDGDNLFVFLPLSVLQQRYWIYSALRFGHDVTICTYQAAFPALAAVAPTVVMGVPGFYETARTHIEALAGGDDAAVPVRARQLFGDRIRYLWTGSAPARPDTVRFFTELGMPLFEGYGLNEACIVTKNHPGAFRPGSVGKPLPGKEILFDEDGRIQVRSDWPVSRRYEYAAPGESERMFGADGVVRTGDLGYLDADGFLYVLGRADDVIVLDNGRKVIVRPMEERLKASPAIAECVVFCPDQTNLVAVVSPAGAADERAIATHLAAANAAAGRDEQITRLVVAREPFSVDNGLLTSQLKPKRRRILQAYRSEIYDSQETVHAP